MKTVSQTTPAVVIVQFDQSIPLPPLTSRRDSLESSIALYLRRVFGPAADLEVVLGKPGQVLSNGRLVASFKVSPLTAGPARGNSLGVAA